MQYPAKLHASRRCAAAIALLLATAGVGMDAARAQELIPGDPTPRIADDEAAFGSTIFDDEAPPGPGDFEELHTLRVDDGPILYEQPLSDAPVLTDYTGDMVRRREWYLKTDFVFLNRGRADKVPLSVKTVGLEQNTERGLILVTKGLTGASVLLRTAPGTRLTLGRHLGVDDRNRDWDLEFTYLGLFDWDRQFQMVSEEDPVSTLTNSLLFLTNNDAIPGFSAAVNHRLAYSSDFNNLELNMRISQRPTRDRRVLSPNGVWTREINSALQFDMLGGVRFIRQNEQFAFISRGPDPELQQGDYLVETKNDLIGLQIGGGCVYEKGWWHVGASGKAGGYINMAEQHSRVHIIDDRADSILPSGQYLGPVPPDRDERASSQAMAGVGELELFASAHLRSNIRVRAGWNLMLIQGLALAPEQVTFEQNGVAYISDSGLNVNTGWTLGAEMMW